MRDLNGARGIGDHRLSHGLSGSGTRRHGRLLTALRLIANDLHLVDPTAEAKKTQKRLLRRIGQEIAARVRNRRYDAFIDRSRSVRERPNERWACYLVRLEANRQSIGRLRGTRLLNRETTIDNAAGATPEELIPVQRRAFEMLKRGGKRQRVKSRKNAIEKRAIRLAERVERTWFPNKPKSMVGAKRDIDRPILLSITDVISIAAPIIEEFAKAPIVFRERGSDSDPPSFEALYSIVCAYAKDGVLCKKSTVGRLFSRVRNRGDAHLRQGAGVRIEIAPELGGSFNDH